MENDWLTYAKRLQATALTGLAYSRIPYDIEVGFSPAQNVVKEIEEEACIHTVARQL